MLQFGSGSGLWETLLWSIASEQAGVGHIGAESPSFWREF